MHDSTNKARPTKPRGGDVVGVYRGVVLHRLPGRPSVPLEQIRKALEEALAADPDLRARVHATA